MTVYLMDARTKDGKLRITSFSEDSLAELYSDFKDWMRENELRNEDLWFARVFDTKGPRHVGDLKLDELGIVRGKPAPPDSRLTLKDSRYTFRVRLRYLLNRL